MQRYDVVIDGMNCGTLAVAALLCTTGKKVLISTEAASVDQALGVWNSQGFHFSPGPKYAFGLEAGGAVRGLFDDLDISMTETVSPIGYQIALPDRRITVSRDQSGTFEELKREFPGDFAAITEFYRVLAKESAAARKSRIKKYLADRSTASRFINRYHFSPALLSFYDVQARYFFNSSLASLSLSGLMQLCLTMPAAVPGAERIAGALSAAVANRGGSIRYQEPMQEIVFRRSRAVGMKTSRETVDARSLLICDTASTVNGFYLGVHEQVMPAGMLDTVLYLPDYSQPSRFIAITASGSEDRECAPIHMRSLVVESHSTDQPFYQDELLDRCADIIPFLKEHLVVANPVHVKGPSPHVTKFPLKQIQTGRGDPVLFKTPRSHLFVYRAASHDLFCQVSALYSIMKQIS